MLLPGAAGEFFTVNGAAPVHIRHVVNVVGDPAGARPLIKVDSPSPANFTFETDAAGSTLSHVAFEKSGFYPITASARVSLSDLSVKASGGCLQLEGTDSSLVDSTLESTIPSGVATAGCLLASGNGHQIRNVDITSGRASDASIFVDAATLFGSGIQVDGLRVRSDTEAIRASGGVVMRRVDVRGTNLGVALGQGAVFTDSLLVMNGDNPRAVSASGAVLRNVSASATGSGSVGLYIQAAGDTSVTTDVRNSILRGGDKDVFVEETYPGQGDPTCMPGIDPGCITYIPRRTAGTLVIGNSNFLTTEVRPGGTVTDAGGNSTADPLFVNPAAGDFHLSPGSPAIDAGADFAENGPLDLDGNPRKLGSAPDMGPYEFVPALAPADTTSPVVESFGVTNRVFAVGRAPTRVVAPAKRTKRGTTFVFRSSEPGTATLTMSRARPGRRRGKRCVKPTKKNRRAKACTRYTRIRPSLKRTVGGGYTAVGFSGRIGRRALRPGSYRTTLVVADAAGNRSKSKSLRFRIVRR